MVVLTWLPWVAALFVVGWLWLDGVDLHAIGGSYTRPAISDGLATSIMSAFLVFTFLLCGARSMVYVLGEWLPRRNLRPDRCPRCGYTVPYDGPQFCPECGETSTRAQRGTAVPLIDPRGIAAWVARLVIASLAGFVMGMLSSALASRVG
jgi:predicted RNA-binding Zn-ribbon protein involved in translation (DUF1610 family)